ncbi:MAG TPA: MFS transporter [Nannocystaceae bacterium]|nr:MFS transporter [Nannocystaceae bacterium]
MAPRLTLLTLLYFCQGLPGGFLAVALPVILRERGLSMAEIGLASLVSLPWVLKVLWAPLVDRWWSPRIGRRRTWMVPAQLGMLACTLTLAQFDPSAGLLPIVVLFLVLNVFAATQDVAVDGYAVDLLHGRDLGPANAAQVGGFKLGNIMGGGVLLALSAVLGWYGDFLIMAGCIAVALVLVLVVPEPPPVAPPQPTWTITSRAFEAVFGHAPFAAFLVAAKFGETFGGAPIKPTLVDLGFTRALIGTIDGIVGGVATVLGALAAGLLVRSAGWRTTFFVMSVTQGVALVVLGLYLAGDVEVVAFAIRIAIENFAGGGVAVAVFALAMSRCSPATAGAEFTAMQVLYMGGAALAGPLAGASADALGVLPVMIAGGAMAIAVGLVVALRGAALERTP